MSGDQLLEIYRHARAAFPRECCGWLTARTVRPARNAQEDGEHPTAADRTAETAYVISGEDLLALNRAFKSDDPPLIIYHSHPNGRAYFSATDQAVATDPWGEGPMYPVEQLVVGIDGERVVEAALFGWSDSERKFVELRRFEGAAL